MRNYIKAGHGPLGCTDSITYTTHADYTFLDNVIPLLERWRGPLSIALHAPGSDFAPTLDTIRYLRDCARGSELVREYVTFHIYFGSKHMPKQVSTQYYQYCKYFLTLNIALKNIVHIFEDNDILMNY